MDTEEKKVTASVSQPRIDPGVEEVAEVESGVEESKEVTPIIEEEEEVAYLDNAATTRVHRSVLDAMMKHMTLEYDNPHSIHGGFFSSAVAEDLFRVLFRLFFLPEIL